MLVLSRRENQSIVIDGRVTVRVLAIQGGRVRLAVEAPQEIPVRRSELPILEPARLGAVPASRPLSDMAGRRWDARHSDTVTEGDAVTVDQDRRGLESAISPTTTHTSTKAQPMIV